ncbi:MAG: PDZ domain-containing protein [Sphingomonadales bacterium]|nr:PDZ domain-containing protein [Sphingomonadales bacterium]
MAKHPPAETASRVPAAAGPGLPFMALALIAVTAALTSAGIALDNRLDATALRHGPAEGETWSHLLDFTATPASPGRVGLTVTSIRSGGTADRAGLDVGDAIEAVDGTPVRSIGDVAQRLRSRPARPMQLRVRHAGADETIVLASRTD